MRLHLRAVGLDSTGFQVNNGVAAGTVSPAVPLEEPATAGEQRIQLANLIAGRRAARHTYRGRTSTPRFCQPASPMC